MKAALLVFYNVFEKELRTGKFVDNFIQSQKSGVLSSFLADLTKLIDRSSENLKVEQGILKLTISEQVDILHILGKLSLELSQNLKKMCSHQDQSHRMFISGLINFQISLFSAISTTKSIIENGQNKTVRHSGFNRALEGPYLKALNELAQ